MDQNARKWAVDSSPNILVSGVIAPKVTTLMDIKEMHKRRRTIERENLLIPQQFTTKDAEWINTPYEVYK